MTATASTVPGRGARAGGRSLSMTVADGWALTRRNLLHYIRIPQALFFSSVQPIMFVLLFRYAFGGAIPIPGVDYVNYLMPGIFVQTVVFGATATAVGLAEDMHSGLMERFRSLPIAQPTVLVGRTNADLGRNLLVVVLMTIVGFIVGFRIQTNLVSFLAGVAVVLLFSYALSWGFALVGLFAENAETAQLMSFPLLLPLVFASSAFVPVETMPGWLQAFSNNQPVTHTVNAVRELMVDYPAAADDVWKSVTWSLGLLLIMAPLAVWRFRRTMV
jgi:ABC-2 type transport system permease protein/oleandomycin transport system permease protein